MKLKHTGSRVPKRITRTGNGPYHVDIGYRISRQGDPRMIQYTTYFEVVDSLHRFAHTAKASSAKPSHRKRQSGSLGQNGDGLIPYRSYSSGSTRGDGDLVSNDIPYVQ